MSLGTYDIRMSCPLLTTASGGMGGCIGLFGAYSLIPLTTCPCGIHGDISVCRGPQALWPLCRWRQNIYYYNGMQQTSVHSGTISCYKRGWVKQNLVFYFTFVRVNSWPQWNGRSFFQDHLWVIWTTEAGIKTSLWFRVCAFWLLLPQWYYCLAQFHLRGRGWTNFSLLFITGMITDHHLHSLQDFESLGTSICGICYDIAEQYWAAWRLSESVVFHVVV